MFDLHTVIKALISANSKKLTFIIFHAALLELRYNVEYPNFMNSIKGVATRSLDQQLVELLPKMIDKYFKEEYEYIDNKGKVTKYIIFPQIGGDNWITLIVRLYKILTEHHDNPSENIVSNNAFRKFRNFYYQATDKNKCNKKTITLSEYRSFLKDIFYFATENTEKLKRLREQKRESENTIDQIKSTEENSIKLIKENLKILDTRINGLLPHKLISSRLKDEQGTPIKDSFKADKVFSSLSLLGIPYEVNLDVISYIEKEIRQRYKTKNEIKTTDDLRKLISKALYQLDPNNYENIYTQNWSDKYIRKYGHPDNRIYVVENNEEQLFNYSYVKKLLIELFFELIGVNFNNSSIPNIDDMQFEIVEYVKNLNLYLIHKDTMVFLVRDLALQPPHPWIVLRPYRNDSLDYDIKKSSEHFIKMKSQLDNDEFHECRHSIIECASHTSSAILSYYGCFLGCGHLAPLRNIINLVQYIRKNQLDNALLTSSKFIDIVQDIKTIPTIHLDINKFAKVLRDIKTGLCTSPFINIKGKYTDQFETKKNLSNAINNISVLYKIMIELTSQSLRYSNKDIENAFDNPASENLLYDITFNTLSLIPDFQLQEHKGEKLFDFIRIVYNGTNGLSKYILVHVINKSTAPDASDFLTLKSIYEKKSQFYNFHMIVCKSEYSESVAKMCRDFSDKDITFVHINKEIMMELFKGNDRIDKFADYVESFILA